MIAQLKANFLMLYPNMVLTPCVLYPGVGSANAHNKMRSRKCSSGGREQRVNALIYKRAGALLPKTKVSFQ